MPTQKYALVRGEEKKLVATWNVGWSNLHIELDGKKIGTIETRTDLQKGKTFTLPDKSKLEVRLQSSILSTGLALTRNGVPVPDSVRDPMTSIRGGWQIAHVVAAYNIVIGFLFVLLKYETSFLPNFGYITFTFGIGYLILARMLRRKSLPALIALIILFSLETLLEAATNYSFFVLFRAAIIYYLFLGIGAFKKFKTEEMEKPEQIPMISE